MYLANNFLLTLIFPIRHPSLVNFLIGYRKKSLEQTLCYTNYEHELHLHRESFKTD